MIEESRQCRKCYLTKPIEEFTFVDINKIFRRRKCKSCRAEQNLDWRLRNPDKTKQYVRDADERVRNGENPHRFQAKKIRINNSNMIRRIFICRDKSFIKHFGCIKKVFMNRFEKYFEKNPGMGWHNYGAWHMDHIKPMKEFDLDTEASRKLCNHYTNVRPAWALVNMQKSSKYEVEQTI